MPIPIHDTAIYDVEVDPSAPNHAHSFTLAMVGFNKRVLELGCTGGHFTRALVKQACTVVGVEIDGEQAERAREWAEQVIVGDLDDPAALSDLEEAQFDAVTAGDVLEHLRDPMTVLRTCRRLLKPGGFLVVSLPNVAHADVRLALLDGAFTYRENGLLDTTHLRFFTRHTIADMARSSGFLITEIERVVVPIFMTEMGVDRSTIPDDLIARVLADPDAETYQFVFKAVLDDGNVALGQLSQRYQEAKATLQARAHENAALRNQLAQAEARVAAAAATEARATEQRDAAEEKAAAATADLEALHRTRLLRYTASARLRYGALRRSVGLGD